MISTTATRSARETLSPMMNGLFCRNFSSRRSSDCVRSSTAASILSLGTSEPMMRGYMVCSQRTWNHWWMFKLSCVLCGKLSKLNVSDSDWELNQSPNLWSPPSGWKYIHGLTLWQITESFYSFFHDTSEDIVYVMDLTCYITMSGQ